MTFKCTALHPCTICVHYFIDVCDTVHVFFKLHTVSLRMCQSCSPLLACAGVRVCWCMGACEGVCIRDYLELYIIILYNMCNSCGIWVRVRVFVCVGCSSVLVYGCV